MLECIAGSRVMEKDPFTTLVPTWGSAIVTELSAAGFAYAEEVGRGGFGIVYRCTESHWTAPSR